MGSRFQAIGFVHSRSTSDCVARTHTCSSEAKGKHCPGGFLNLAQHPLNLTVETAIPSFKPVGYAQLESVLVFW
eukprot:363345-Amphidinium_carterae.1